MGKQSSRKKRNKKTPNKINPLTKEILKGVLIGIMVNLAKKLINYRIHLLLITVFSDDRGVAQTSSLIKE